jgi:hypothetical protein
MYDVDWNNAVWQVMHLYISGGGCLRQWGFIYYLVVALSPPNFTCDQQAPFTALENGFDDGCAGVVVAECYSSRKVTQPLLHAVTSAS